MAGGRGRVALTGPYFPPDVGKPGERIIPLERQILIDREDFAVDPPPGYQRLAPGRTVRLRYGPCITCDDVVTEGGEVAEVRCHHVPDSIGKNPPGVKVSGVIHWVPATRSVAAEVRLYDRLFLAPRPEDGSERRTQSRLRGGGAGRPPRAQPGRRRAGKPVAARTGRLLRVRPTDSQPDAPVLNRIVTLRDSWQHRAPAGGQTGAGAGSKTGPDQHPPSEEEPHRIPG